MTNRAGWKCTSAPSWYLKELMLYNTKQLYTPPLERYEFNRHALIIDTETVGSGPLVEIIEIALGDIDGNIIYQNLIQPTFNPLPPLSKHKRFDRAEFAKAPDWPSVWPEISSLVDGRLLIAYNAAFDRRALAATCSRYQQRSPERGWRCAMQLVKQAIGTRKSLTLEEACLYYGLEGGNHRAGRDVQATYQLLKFLMSPVN
jgi:DNA polymerase III epsilon subunit-like protein